jgi:hypothetical protein
LNLPRSEADAFRLLVRAVVVIVVIVVIVVVVKAL